MGNTGYPSLNFLDSDGQFIVKQRARTVAAFEKTAGAVQTLFKYKDKKDLGERAAVRYFIARLQLGQFNLEQAKQGLDKLGKLGANNVTIVNDELATLEYNEIYQEMRKSSRVRTRGKRVNMNEIRDAAGKRFAAMFKKGRIPKGQINFWSYLIGYAESEKNVQLAVDALAVLQKDFGENKRYYRMVKALAGRVERLKENAGG